MPLQMGDKVLALDTKLLNLNGELQERAYMPATVLLNKPSSGLVDIMFDHDKRISKGHFIAYLRPCS